MVTRSLKALSRADLSVWWEAYLTVLPVVLGSNGNLVERSSERLGELTADAAWKALDQYRKAAKGERP